MSIVKYILLSLMLGVVASGFYACNKYSDFKGNCSISGTGRIIDNLGGTLPQPLAKQTVYLNTGTDTTSYIGQVSTDTTGHFTISSLNEGSDYILFARFVKGNTWYTGTAKVHTGEANSQMATTLDVYPQYVNGLFIVFTDVSSGNTPNLPFRLYRSRSAAVVDSVKYASLTDKSDMNGQYAAYNLTPGKYYIVAADSLAGAARKILDSADVAATGVNIKTVILK